MRLQYVFGNPTYEKTKKSKRSKSVARRKKKRNPMVKSVTLKEKTGSKGGKPVYAKKGETKSTGRIVTKGELAQINAAVAQARANAKLASEKARMKSTPKAQKKALRTMAKKFKTEASKLASAKKLKAQEAKAKLAEVNLMIKDFKAIESSRGKDVKVETKTQIFSAKGKKVRRKKKTKSKKTKAKKTKAKKAGSKKKASKKVRRKKSTKRKKTSKKAAKKSTRKSSRRRRKAKKSVGVFGSVFAGKKSTSAKLKVKKKLKKGEKVTKHTKSKNKRFTQTLKRTNPKRGANPVIGADFFQRFPQLGPIAGQMGALALGGAFYGYSNKLLGTYAAPVQSALNKVPVVGPTLPNLLVGVGLTMLSKQAFVSKNKMVSEVISTIGQGLIGAAAVGIGVNASQMIPLLDTGTAGMHGINYVPGRVGQIPGSSQVDFGGVDFTPEMGGVDFTPEMAGVDFTREMGSENPAADFGEYQQSNADFGEYQQSSADFGMIPEGLG